MSEHAETSAEKRTQLESKLETKTEYRTPTQQLVHEFRNDLMGMIALVLLFGIVLSAIFGPMVTIHSPTEPSYDAINQPPSADHLLGTDHLGRDVLSRVLSGARYSLIIGVGSITFAGVLGITLGSIAGYTRREWLDELVMRLLDILIAFPAILLGIAVMGMMDNLGGIGIGVLERMILIIGAVYAPRFARVTRGAVLKERNKDYVEIAKLDGMSDTYILTREISLNIISPLLVLFSYRIGSAMIVAAGLGFLGIGVQPPQPGWGVMIATGKEYIINGHWWMIVAPGTALALTIMSFNMIGDAVRDALDPNVSTLEEG